MKDSPVRRTRSRMSSSSKACRVASPATMASLVLGEGRRVDDGAVHRAVDAVGHLGRAEHGPHRDVAAREGLRDGDDVGLDVEVLVAEEPARPAQAGLDLVHDEEGLVPPAQLLDRVPVVVGGEVDALALDGFDDEGGHVAGAELPGQRVDVAERDLVGRRAAARSRRGIPSRRSTRAPRW